MNDSIGVWKLITIDDQSEYLRLLGQLSPVSEISAEDFEQFCNLINKETWLLWENNQSSNESGELRLLAIGSLYYLPKICRGGTLVGLIEDIVVDEDARGRGLGKQLIEFLIQRAQKLGCYKCLLSSSETNFQFYQKCGLVAKEKTMMKYF